MKKRKEKKKKKEKAGPVLTQFYKVSFHIFVF